jgi:DNA-binding GntR family transcriptional regulator
MIMREQPRRQVLADRVYELVKAMVMDHEIAPGARISIDGLARELDVSPTPVREALARLESEGLVTKRSLVGYRATELLGAAALVDLFEMRLLLEPRAASLAAANASDRHLDRLEVIVEEMRAHPVTGPGSADYPRFAALDQEFHDVLAAAADRPLLADAIRRLHAHLHMFRLRNAPDAGGPTVAEHERILRAVLRRTPERAAEAMVAHLRSSQDRHGTGAATDRSPRPDAP